MKNTTKTGQQAEKAAAKHLKKLGYKIIDQNWRTRWCEIDIIAQKNSTTHFVEVKHRKTNYWGDGLDAITPTKVQKMTFAAELWVSNNNWQGDYCLLAISTTGTPPSIIDLVELY